MLSQLIFKYIEKPFKYVYPGVFGTLFRILRESEDGPFYIRRRGSIVWPTFCSAHPKVNNFALTTNPCT